MAEGYEYTEVGHRLITIDSLASPKEIEQLDQGQDVERINALARRIMAELDGGLKAVEKSLLEKWGVNIRFEVH